MPIPLLNDKKKIEAGHAEKYTEKRVVDIGNIWEIGRILRSFVKKGLPLLNYEKIIESRPFYHIIKLLKRDRERQGGTGRNTRKTRKKRIKDVKDMKIMKKISKLRRKSHA
jgi:hypothetical protein